MNERKLKDISLVTKGDAHYLLLTYTSHVEPTVIIKTVNDKSAAITTTERNEDD